MAAIDPAFAGEIDRLAEDQVDLVERLLRLQPGDRILDLGCGGGRHSILLQERGYQATGLDLSEAVLAIARGAWQRRHGGEDGPRWVQGDMREPPAPRPPQWPGAPADAPAHGPAGEPALSPGEPTPP